MPKYSTPWPSGHAVSLVRLSHKETPVTLLPTRTWILPGHIHSKDPLCERILSTGTSPTLREDVWACTCSLTSGRARFGALNIAARDASAAAVFATKCLALEMEGWIVVLGR